MAKVFVFNGFHGIGNRVAKEIIESHSSIAKIVNLDEYGREKAKSVLYDLVKESGDKGDRVFVLPDVEVCDELVANRAVALLTHTAMGDTSVITEVAAMVGHRLTRYEMLASAFDTGYLSGLKAMDATDEEVKMIMLRDRFSRTSDVRALDAEEHACILLEGKKPEAASDVRRDGWAVYCYPNQDSATTNALLDGLFYRLAQPEENNCVLFYPGTIRPHTATVYFQSRLDAEAAKDRFGRNGYQFAEIKKDRRTKMFFSVITKAKEDEDEDESEGDDAMAPNILKPLILPAIL